jgi:hypothetical protein
MSHTPRLLQARAAYQQKKGKEMAVLLQLCVFVSVLFWET